MASYSYSKFPLPLPSFVTDICDGFDDEVLYFRLRHISNFVKLQPIPLRGDAKGPRESRFSGHKSRYL